MVEQIHLLKKLGIYEIQDTGEVFETMTAASKKYPGISRQSISHNCAGRTKKAGGFRWEYVKDE